MTPWLGATTDRRGEITSSESLKQRDAKRMNVSLGGGGIRDCPEGSPLVQLCSSLERDER